MSDAETIVRALANASPYAEVGDMYHVCALCGEGLPVRPEDHASDCPWRLAVEHVAAASLSRDKT